MKTNNQNCELVFDAHAIVGERPLWDPNEHAVIWVDIMGKTVFVMEQSGLLRKSYLLESHVGAAIPASLGGWLLATSEGFSYLSREGNVEEILDVLSGNPALRFNDMGCDSHGRAFAGTMRYDCSGWEGILYRLDGKEDSWQVTELVTGLGISNGIGWSPDERHMYLVDSNAKSVFKFKYDVDRGTLYDKEVLLDVRSWDGIPDGLSVDVEGYIWIAFYGGGVVRRFSDTGKLDRELRLPVAYPTCPGFGLEGHLFITTAFSTDDIFPGSGGLWLADVGVQGCETQCWSGKR